jgi:hypothetical protein
LKFVILKSDLRTRTNHKQSARRIIAVNGFSQTVNDHRLAGRDGGQLRLHIDHRDTDLHFAESRKAAIDSAVLVDSLDRFAQGAIAIVKGVVVWSSDCQLGRGGRRKQVFSGDRQRVQDAYDACKTAQVIRMAAKRYIVHGAFPCNAAKAAQAVYQKNKFSVYRSL